MFILYGELVCGNEREAAVTQEVEKKKERKEIRDRWTERKKEKKSKNRANG